MTAEQTLSFGLPDADDAIYLLEIDQGGLDLKVKFPTPEDPLEIHDFPTNRDDMELVLLEPGRDRPRSFEIFSDEFTGTVAHPRILLSRLDPDDDLLPAYRLLTEASRAYGAGNWEQSLEKLEQTLPLLDTPDTARRYARSQLGMATLLYWDKFDFGNANESALLAERAYRAAGDEALATAALFLRASSMIEQAGEIEKTPSQGIAPEAQVLFDESLDLQRRARATQQALGNRFEAAFILNNMGYTYYMMGEYDQAQEHWEPAAKELAALREWEFELWPLQNMGVIDFDRGYLVRAVEAFKRGLEILPPGRSNGTRQFLLNNLGGGYLELGELDQALKSFSSALELHEITDELTEQASALKGIGLTYVRFGETGLGMEYLESAIPIQRETSSYRELISSLNEMGRQYLARGDYQAALEAHREAEKTAVMQRDRAKAQLGLIEDLVAMGEAEQAMEILPRTLQVAEELESRNIRAEALKLYGDAWFAAAQYGKALDSYRDADAMYAEQGLAIERSRTLFGMSRSFARLADTEPAVAYAVQAIEAVESHRASLSTPQLRAFFMARRQDYYAHLIETLVALHESTGSGDTQHLEQALAYSERSHARSLVDLINEATQLDSGTGQNAEKDALLKELAEARFRLLDNAKKQQTQSDVETTRHQLADIENRLNLLEIELRNDNPAYAKLVNPVILDASAIQGMLDPDAALLQYALGSEKSFVFLVTTESIQAWPLPGKARIEQGAKTLYELLRTPTRSRADRDQLDERVASFSRQILPPGDAMPQQRLLVVADGVLQYLPFSVLLAANGAGASAETVSPHQVVNVPSMSVLAAHRENQDSAVEPGKTIAIFADPVFSADDRRVTGVLDSTLAAGSAQASRQPSNLAEPRDLERLPATAYEAETIAGLVTPDRRTVRTGFEASRDGVLGANLADYRVVHFATHGKIDSRYPALSWLAFSQVAPDGREQNGLVRLHDIYNLDLNADLVTMSACDTALGREISGEGLTGLVQGFMYSGARSVLASLWQVPDRATAELMGLFYRNLFELEQKPAEALRNAQQELSSRSRFRHPYYWSAFVLQGDWE